MPEGSDALTVRAERSRHHLSELVDRLQNQITPAELVNQLIGRGRSTSDEPNIVETLADQVRRNPLACALIAAGIGWLMSEKAERNRYGFQGKRIARRRPAAGKRRTRKKIPA